MEKNQPLCEKCGKEKCFDHGKPRSEHLCHAFSGHCHGSCQEPSGKERHECNARCPITCGSKPYCEGHRYLSHKNGDLPYYNPAECVQCEKEKHPTPSAPTPGEDWEEEFEEELSKLKNTNYETEEPVLFGYRARLADTVFTITDFGNIKSFIRNLLSSHASKAREEGRKEGAEETWARAVEVVEKAHEKNHGLFDQGIAVSALREEAAKK